MLNTEPLLVLPKQLWPVLYCLVHRYEQWVFWVLWDGASVDLDFFPLDPLRLVSAEFGDQIKTSVSQLWSLSISLKFFFWEFQRWPAVIWSHCRAMIVRVQVFPSRTLHLTRWTMFTLITCQYHNVITN